MLRNLMDQVKIAKAAKDDGARCQVTGYARPRRYDLLSQDRKPVNAKPPTIVSGMQGALVSWTDARDGQRRAYAASLDDAMRNAAPPVDVTPEGYKVRTPTLLPVAERFVAAYWDAGGASPGVYLRWLGSDGAIAGPPVRVTEKRAGNYVAHATRTDDGGFLISWSEHLDKDSKDLFMRRYDKTAAPAGETVRLSDYVARGSVSPMITHVSSTARGNQVHLAYTVSMDRKRQIRMQTVAADSAPPGLEDEEAKEDRTVGHEIAITQRRNSAINPSIGCVDEGCYIAWQFTLRGGAGVAFVETATKKVQWHKRFTMVGKNPTVAASPTGDVQLVWHEGGRLITSSLSRSGLGPRSKIAKVVGSQPPASLAPGPKRGEWYVAWLDYESGSGHLEPYATRIVCQ
jgi:hypothetical protein